MDKMSILSQLYETADRFYERFPDLDYAPDWNQDQIIHREKQMEINLACDKTFRDAWNVV